MKDVFAEAAGLARVPEELREEVIARAQRNVGNEIVYLAADRMHETVMGCLAQDGTSWRTKRGDFG